MSDQAIENAARHLAASISSFRIGDGIMIAAVIVAPLLALQISAALDGRRAARAGKEWVFRTLIATRANTLAERHVEALNLIDVEFYHVDDVREAWRLYIDHLGTPVAADPQWGDKRVELLAKLLHVMSKHLGYKFDLVHLKRAVYAPQAHGDNERDWASIRAGLAQLLSHGRTLPVELTTLPTTDEEVRAHDEMQAVVKALLHGNRAFSVTLKNEPSSPAQSAGPSDVDAAPGQRG